MGVEWNDETKASVRISYALRRVPKESFACLLPGSASPQPGDIGLARLEKIGRNANLELSNGRRSTLHEGVLLAVVFGNRYATLQFEGYARADGEHCDLLSMGGLCGLVESKHAKAGDPSKLRLLGFLGDTKGRRLKLRDFAISPPPPSCAPRVIGVCGTSMDAGKTQTATSLIMGLHGQNIAVAGVKLTGTATGKDAWNMLDAGACAALDFVDGGYPSTYLCSLEELLTLHRQLIAEAASQGAKWVVLEIADGLLQRETAALLKSSLFTETVDAWVFAAADPLAAAGGISVLRERGITPLAISGVVSMSPLAIRETQLATGLHCYTSMELQRGDLNADITGIVPRMLASSWTVVENVVQH
jgi:hypothetical protein